MSTRSCHDIRAQAQPFCTAINGSIACALVSALVSSVDSYTGDASAFNGPMLQAAHWLLVVLLAVFYVQPKKCVNPNVELLWLAYGFLLGEIDSDSIVAWVFIVASAILYFVYQRQGRLEASANVMPAAESHSDDDETAAI